MKNIDIDWAELVFTIFMIITCAVLVMFAISAYQDTQSRIKWRETTSLKTLEMVKYEAVNEYISKQGG